MYVVPALGFDAALLLQDFTQQLSYQASSPHSSSFADDLQHKTVDLESLDYYALDMFPPTARQPDLAGTSRKKDGGGGRRSTCGGSGSGGGGGLARKTYAWEEEDFGLLDAQVS